MFFDDIQIILFGSSYQSVISGKRPSCGWEWKYLFALVAVSWMNCPEQAFALQASTCLSLVFENRPFFPVDRGSWLA